MWVATMQSLSETWYYRALIVSHDADDAQEAFLIDMEARSIADAQGHLDTAYMRNSIGKAVMEYFRLNCLRGHVEHSALADAIVWFNRALEICPPSDALYTEVLRGLAFASFLRFQRCGGDFADLDKAIELFTTAVNLVLDPTTEEHGAALMQLVDTLIYRHAERKPDHHDDLDLALEYSHKALALLPEGNQYRSMFFQFMASIYDFHHTKSNTEPYSVERTHPNYDLQVPNLEMSIKYAREAVTACHPAHPRYLTLLQDLRECVLDRYHLKFILCDIDEVIDINRRIITFYPVGHPQRKCALMFFGYALNMRYQRPGLHRPEDWEETMKVWEEAMSLKTDYDWWAEDSLASQMLDAAMWQLKYETRLAEERGEVGPMSSIPDIDPSSVPMMEVDLDKPPVF